MGKNYEYFQVLPICLPSVEMVKKAGEEGVVGKKATISGWGKVSISKS